MTAIVRRVKKLESVLVDGSGLVHHSEAWFDFFENRLTRSFDGENIGNIRIPLEVFDRLIEADDREARKSVVA